MDFDSEDEGIEEDDEEDEPEDDEFDPMYDRIIELIEEQESLAAQGPIWEEIPIENNPMIEKRNQKTSLLHLSLKLVVLVAVLVVFQMKLLSQVKNLSFWSFYSAVKF